MLYFDNGFASMILIKSLLFTVQHLSNTYWTKDNSERSADNNFFEFSDKKLSEMLMFSAYLSVTLFQSYVRMLLIISLLSA
jgi:hypothetical protein